MANKLSLALTSTRKNNSLLLRGYANFTADQEAGTNRQNYASLSLSDNANLRGFKNLAGFLIYEVCQYGG
jgi:hypothetical protein